MTAGNVLIFGLGYAGTAIGQALASRGWQVAGTTRMIDQRRSRWPDDWNVIAWQAGAGNAGLAEIMASTDALITTIGPAGLPDSQLPCPVCAAIPDLLAGFDGWTGYISATSVYGPSDRWIDETVRPAPVDQRGKARLAAEAQWQGLAPQTEIFRAAGIYGPGRNYLARLRAGTIQPIRKPGHLFNRIYIDDLAMIVAAALDQKRAGRVINLADGAPAEQAEILAGVADMAGLALPAPVDFEQAGLTGMAASFWQHSRKITSGLIGPELGLKLSCPDWRAGYRQILEDEAAEGSGPA